MNLFHETGMGRIARPDSRFGYAYSGCEGGGNRGPFSHGHEHCGKHPFLPRNGEIASDYDDLGLSITVWRSIFLQSTIEGMAFDGKTDRHRHDGGLSCDLQVCQTVAEGQRLHGPFIIMGRSLGSASVMELAARYPTEIDGSLWKAALPTRNRSSGSLASMPAAWGLEKKKGFATWTRSGPTVSYPDHPCGIRHIIPFPTGKRCMTPQEPPGKSW